MALISKTHLVFLMCFFSFVFLTIGFWLSTIIPYVMTWWRERSTNAKLNKNILYLSNEVDKIKDDIRDIKTKLKTLQINTFFSKKGK